FAHHRTGVVAKPSRARHRPHHHRRAFAAFLRPRPEGSQPDAVVVDGDGRRAPSRVLQWRYRAHHRIRIHPRAARSLRPGHARSRCVPSDLGPANALAAHRLLGGGVLMPVHWGTFALSTHAWDEPVEDLLALADPDDTALLLPRLGEPAEPVERRDVQPWWRRGQVVGDKSLVKPEPPEPAISGQLSEQLPWPLD